MILERRTSIERTLASFRARMWAGAIALMRPAPCAALLAGALMMLACNIHPTVERRGYAFRIVYPHAFVLLVVLAAAIKAYALLGRSGQDVMRAAVRALLWIVPFCALVGLSPLVSNGTVYAAMSSDYWSTDPLASISRRLGMPVLANVLGFTGNAYPVFWYLCCSSRSRSPCGRSTGSHSLGSSVFRS